MNRTLPLLVTVLAALAGAARAPAADPDGNYVVFGAGRISCNTFLQDRAQGMLDRYKSYTLGYLSAWNALSADTYSISGERPLETILDLVAEACGDRRVEAFERVLRAVVAGFADSRARSAPKAGRGWGR